MSCEYGTNYLRPHFHAIIFGHQFPNLKLHKTTPRGSKIYRSDQLEKLWNKGFSSIGEANESTAYYIASYCLANTKREILSNDGELIIFKDFMRSSRRPALGLTYFLQNHKNILEQTLHFKQSIPLYYKKKYEQLYPEEHQTLTNHNSEHITSPSCHEKHAKQVIENQKKKLFSEFRDQSVTDEEIAYTKQLEKDRDDYVSYLNGNHI